MGEFELIELIRARVARAGSDASVVLGIGDDAAVIRPDPGMDLVAATDTLVSGRHFAPDGDPFAIGHQALAVNLSDIAAMGAEPRWLLLSLTLPEVPADWINGFLDGFLALAASTGTVLVGGNLASGPLSITVQVMGQVEPGRAVSRAGGAVDDLIVVTGTVGSAAAALQLGDQAAPPLVQRLQRPEPRMEAGRRVAPFAHAMVDISDGLVADLTHMLSPGLGARLALEDLPADDSLRQAVPEDARRWLLQLAGGGDYELLALIPPSRIQAAAEDLQTIGLPLTTIGQIERAPGVRCLRPDGTLLTLDRAGWDHFR